MFKLHDLPAAVLERAGVKIYKGTRLEYLPKSNEVRPSSNHEKEMCLVKDWASRKLGAIFPD
jgi:hypothetical protein